ncbi:MAG: dienelactone hydrolase, partial [Anaerolineales bacterium]|nr:dienelactone hydrolase [Anaerolineales bacterium]
IESYHWLAVKLAEANIVTVMYTHVAETLPNVIGLTPSIDLAKVKPDTYGSGATCPAIQPILDLLKTLNEDEKNHLYQTVDLNQIILGGHSAGGTVALQNGQFFEQVRAIFSYAGHTMASTMLGFGAGTVLKIASKPTLLMRGDKDGVIAASRIRYGTNEQSPDPIEKTFNEAYQASTESEAYDVLLQGANHFSIAYPLDETTGRFFLDGEMTRAGDAVRNEIANLVRSFINKHIRNENVEIQAEHAVIRKK